MSFLQNSLVAWPRYCNNNSPFFAISAAIFRYPAESISFTIIMFPRYPVSLVFN